ncbi:reverse transcriptase [Globisporangium polare]
MPGKTVLVTGATRGIGLKFVELYGKLGWKVIGAVRNPSKADQLRALKPYKIVQLDTSDESSVLNAAKELEGEAIDLLINNAGIFAGGSLDVTTKEDLLQQFEVNAVGPFLVTRAFTPHLKAAVALTGSALVAQITSFMGSVELTFGEYSGFSAGGRYGYRTSKAALNMINASLAVDLKTDKIGTLALHPGFVQTDLTEHHGEVTADESVSGLMSVIASFEMGNTGAFYDWTGEKMPW